MKKPDDRVKCGSCGWLGWGVRDNNETHALYRCWKCKAILRHRLHGAYSEPFQRVYEIGPTIPPPKIERSPVKYLLIRPNTGRQIAAAYTESDAKEKQSVLMFNGIRTRIVEERRDAQ